MELRRISREVGAIGLGECRCPSRAGPTKALDRYDPRPLSMQGVTLVDTADATAWAERTPGTARRSSPRRWRRRGGDYGLSSSPPKGAMCVPAMADGRERRPAYLRSAAEASLRRLGVEAIGLPVHRPDPKVPYEKAIGVFKELLDAGKVRMVGISTPTSTRSTRPRSVLGEGNLVASRTTSLPGSVRARTSSAICAALGIASCPAVRSGGIGNAEALCRGHPVFDRVATDRGTSVTR